VGVLDAELSVTPLAAEIPGMKNLQEAEHTLWIISLKILGEDLCWLGHST